MKHRLLLMIIVGYVVLLSFSIDLVAGDDKTDVYVLEDITVMGELIRPTKQTGDSLYTGTSVTKKGIELLGTPAKTSVYNVLDILSGINVESEDPYGLSGKDIRIRGLKGFYSGMTVEGIPNYGIMPIGARDDIYDMENMESVSLYKGASPADLGTGSGNRGGSIELQLRRPEDKLGVEVGQSFGSKDFIRTFLRIDSGELPTKTKFFGSYSYTKANKWKGKGDLGPRDHVTLGLNQQFNDVVNIDLFYNFNEIERHFFQPLDYKHADDIDDHFYDHYNNELLSDPDKDVYYYDYNRGKFINRDFMSIIDISIPDKFNLSLKPYYSTEDANFLEGKEGFPVVGYGPKKKKPGVLDKIRDLKRYGVIPEIYFDISDFEITAGYWFESNDLEKYVKRYVTTDDGLEYNGYMYYAKNDGHGEIDSPYVKLSYEFNQFKFQAGLKYFYYKEPASTGYVTDAETLELKEDPDISLKKMDYDEVLPTFGIGYKFNKDTEMYLNYGKNYMRPYAYVPITSLYVTKRKAFKEANMTLQDIFDDWEMETSDNFDLCFRYKHKYFSIAPVFFYSKHNDLLANIDDPRVINPGDNKPISYYQNVGDATAYGFDLELGLSPSKNLIAYFNPSYTNISFDDDFKRGAEPLKIEGNQLPDTPKWIIKSGLIYTINNLEISPTVKWIDSRYGDALHKEKIDDYAVVDLSLAYTIENLGILRKARVGLELNNLFNEKYVGAIVADDMGTGAEYYAGSPFAAVLTISGKF